MKQYTTNELLNQFNKFNYAWYNFHLIGIRSKADAVDQFDDNFYLINGTQCKIYTGTTNPGLYWHKNFDKDKGGVAVLKPGQYINTWSLGLHRGMYTAWTQVKPVVVYRDADKDGKSEKTEVTQRGLFGINVHRASDKWISKVVDRWSAGCQVFNDPKQFEEFIAASKATGQKFFTYTLLDEF